MSNEQQPKPMTYEEIEAVRLHHEAEEWARKQQAPAPQQPMTAEQMDMIRRMLEYPIGGPPFVEEAIRSLLAEVQRLQSLTADDDKLARDMAEEIETLHAEVQRLTELNQASQRRAEEFITGERERLSAEVQRQHGEIERLVTENELIKDEARDDEATVSYLSKENVRLQTENDQLRQSMKSWAETAMGWAVKAEAAQEQLGEAVEAISHEIEWANKTGRISTSLRLQDVLSKLLKGDRTDE